MTRRDPNITVVRLSLFRQLIKMIQQVAILTQKIVSHQVHAETVTWKVDVLVSDFDRVWNADSDNVGEFLWFKDDPIWMSFDIGQHVVNRIRIACQSIISSFLQMPAPL